MADLGAIGHGTFHLYPAKIVRSHERGALARVRHGLHTIRAFSGPARTVSGTLTVAGAPASRAVRAHRRSDGALLGQSVSSAVDGAFSIDCLGYSGPVYVLALDDIGNPTPANALVFDLVSPE